MLKFSFIVAVLCSIFLAGPIQEAFAEDYEAIVQAIINGDVDTAGIDFAKWRFNKNPEAVKTFQALKAWNEAALKDLALKTEGCLGTTQIKVAWLEILSAENAQSYKEFSDNWQEARAIVQTEQEKLDIDLKAIELKENPSEIEGIKNILAIMALHDQFWRSILEQIYNENFYISENSKVILTRLSFMGMCDKDSENLTKLKPILDQINWPVISLYGEAADSDAWLIVQHADLDFQELILERLQTLLPEKETHPGHVALLFDRIAVRQDRPQRYGSQLFCQEGRYVPFQMEDPERIDEMRASVGLGSMSENLERFSEDTC